MGDRFVFAEVGFSDRMNNLHQAIALFLLKLGLAIALTICIRRSFFFPFSEVRCTHKCYPHTFQNLEKILNCHVECSDSEMKHLETTVQVRDSSFRSAPLRMTLKGYKASREWDFKTCVYTVALVSYYQS
ncbi:hypothetical protein [Nostoc sp. UHCC 0870]|uniref:hypothetical protein n=1 Tax=Nostoc sp. UHCC 0870 TaxID=2914041 RepID=UPI001EDF0A1A|nr:hypothetical protein [Nostoc sp. UHCC 0870]UKO96476.1 hypothetical protein L6494_17855 [Nostoc sp. UHCC 0870]